MTKKNVPIHESARRVLEELLQQITLVDFRKKAGIKEHEKVKLNRYVVISMNELVRISKESNWGLGSRNGRIYVFNGQYWPEVTVENLKRFLSKAAIKMGVPELDAQYHTFINDLYEQFLSATALPILKPATSVLINLQNGTFEFNEGKQFLREFRAEDFLIYQLPFEYKPYAKCHLFYKYLWHILPDTDCRKVLAEFIGYIFTNNLNLQKALLLHGTGANGKSVFFDIITALLGEENICSYSLQELTKSGSYLLPDLATKLVNYTSEISRNMNTVIFKQLVSNEPIGVRPIYGYPFTLRDYSCKLIFNCNELPRDVEQNEAFPRRLIIIPFEHIIPKEEQDPNLAKKIIASELSGVFNWALQGLDRLLEQGDFSESEIIQNAITTYRKESDSVALFFEEQAWKKSERHTEPLQDLYYEYCNYCDATGYKKCSKRIMSERLTNLGVKSKRMNIGKVFYMERIPECETVIWIGDSGIPDDVLKELKATRKEKMEKAMKVTE